MIRLCIESFSRTFGKLVACAVFPVILYCLLKLLNVVYNAGILPFLNHCFRLTGKAYAGDSIIFETILASVFCFFVAGMMRKAIWNPYDDAPVWAMDGVTSFRWSFCLVGVICFVSLPLICGLADSLGADIQNIEAAGMVDQAAALKARCVSMASLDDFWHVLATMREVQHGIPR